MNNVEDLITEYINLEKFKENLINYLKITESRGVDVSIRSVDYINSDVVNVQLNVIDGIQQFNVNIEFNIESFTIKQYLFLGSEDVVEIEIRQNKLSFDIDYWSYNITYDQLSRMYETEKILVPDMQRGYVWDHSQASKLIESILMGLPLPSLFLIKQEDGKYLVVDGLQRITTIHAFKYNKKLPNSRLGVAGFALKGVNVNLEGKTYKDLENDSFIIDRFDMGTINVIEFKQNKPDYEEAMYSLFERLNSGGTSLSDQQIRNSIYYGKFNQKLNEFSKNSVQKYFSSKQQMNLIPSELVLRAIAIFDFQDEISNRIGSQIIYKKLLNKTAEKYHIEYKKVERSGDEKARIDFEEKIAKKFDEMSKAISTIEKIFDKDSFKRFDYEEKVYTSRLSPILFESLVVSYLLGLETKTLREDYLIKKKYEEIFREGGEYEEYYTQGTGRKANIIGRIHTMSKVLFND